MYEIYPCSQKALDKIRGSNYRYADLEVGQSFRIPFGEIKIGSLRNKVSVAGKKLGRKFSVIEHDKETGYEVVRIK